MATELQSVYGRLGLDISELVTNGTAATKLLTELRALMQPMTANMTLKTPNAQQLQSQDGQSPQAGQTQQVATLNQVTNASNKAAASTNELSREFERAEEQAIRVSVAQQNWSVALARLENAELLVGKSTQFVTNLLLLRAQAEKGNNAITDARAISDSRAAASSFNYADAAEHLNKILSQAGITQERRIVLERELATVQRQAIQNADAVADAERKRIAASIGGTQAALQANRSDQGGLSSNDPRKLALLREEQQLIAKLNLEQQQLANSHIKGAVNAREYGTAIALIKREISASTGDAERLVTLRNALARATDLERQAGDRLADTYRKQVIANQGLKAGIAQNRNDFAQTPQGAQGDPRRSQLDKELLVLQKQLETQNRQLADSEIALAAASGQHVVALNLVNAALNVSGITQTRYNELMKTGHAILAQHNALVDGKSIRDAKAAAAAGEFAKAEGILNAAMLKVIPASERHIALGNTLAQIQRQAVAAANKYSDALTDQYKKLGALATAHAKVSAELALADKGSQREVDLKTQLIEINKAIVATEQRYLQALAANQAQQRQYANAINALTTAQQQYKAGSTEWLRLQTQINVVMGAQQREQEKLADSNIQAARAARNYAEALRLIGQELSATIPGTDRYNKLLAQQSQVTHQAQGFINRLRASLVGYAAAFLGAQAAVHLFGDAIKYVIGGVQLVAILQEQERGVSAVFNSINRGNETLKEAISFGQKYGFTQKEMGEAASEAAILMQTSAAGAEKTFSVLARLQARAPGKSFNDAVRSIAELQAGQLQSIQRVFNVPARFAQEMRDAIASGIDPIEAVDKVLAKLGQTAGVLEARNQGLSRSFRNLAIQNESLKRELGEVAAGPLQQMTDGFARNAERARDVVHGLRTINQATSEEQFTSLTKAFENFGRKSGDTQWFGAILRTFDAMGDAGNKAEKRLNATGQGMELSLEDLRKQAEKTAPYLASIGTEADKPLTDLEARLRGNATSVNVLVNQYAQGQKTAIEFARSLNEIKDVNDKMFQAQDTFGYVAAIKRDFPDAQARAQELDAAIVALQATIGAAPNSKIANQYIPQLKALANEAIHTKSLFPMTLEIEMKIKQTNLMTNTAQAIVDEGVKLTQDLKQIDQEYITSSAAMQQQHLQNRITAATEIRNVEAKYAAETVTFEQSYINQRTDVQSAFGRTTVALERQFGQERLRTVLEFAKQMAAAEAAYSMQRERSIRDFGLQATRSERDFGQQQAKAARDYGLQLVRTERDFRQQLEKSARDFGLQGERAQRDFNRAEARTREEEQRQLAEGRDKAQKDDQQALKEHLRNLQKMQRDYDIQRSRDTQDFELERMTLLAEGRIAEAQVLASRFAVEQRRNAEDFSRDKSDAGDDFSRGRADTQKNLQDQEAETAAANERARKQRLEDFERQKEDAQAAYDLQLADAKTAHAQQVADAAAAFALQKADAEAAHKQQKDDAAAAFALQLADAEAAYKLQKQAAIDAFAEQQRNAKDAHDAMMAQRVADYKRDEAANTAHHVVERLQRKIAHDEELDQLRTANRAREQQEALDRVAAYLTRQADYAARTREFSKFVDDQTAIFEKAKKDQLAVSELIKSGVQDDLAEARIAMTGTAEFLAKTFAEVDRLTESAGAKAAVAYLQGVTNTLRDQARTSAEIGLGPYANNAVPGYGSRSMASTPWPTPVPAANPYAAGAQYSTRRVTQSQQQPLTINLKADVVMDGKKVGTLVAPHVDAYLGESLAIQVNVNDSVYTPGVQQNAFRSP